MYVRDLIALLSKEDPNMKVALDHYGNYDDVESIAVHRNLGGSGLTRVVIQAAE